MSIVSISPRWQKEIDTFKGIKSTFIVEGNIHDKYAFYSDDSGEGQFLSLNQIIKKMFEEPEKQYECFTCDLIYEFANPFTVDKQTPEFIQACDDYLKKVKPTKRGQDSPNIVLVSEIIRTAITESKAEIAERSGITSGNNKSVVMIINCASRFLSGPESLTMEEMQFFSNLLFASNNNIRSESTCNTLVLVVDKFNDIPAWFYMNNPDVRMITVPNPDRNAREAYINTVSKYLTEKEKESARQMIDMTEGMRILEMSTVISLMKKFGDSISAKEAVSTYKYGYKDNPWEQNRKRLRSIEGGIENKLKESVMGQDRAVQEATKVLKRAVTGISGIQHSSDSKPKGVLFLAGPTGTGKTELAKAIARLVFGDERAIVRFDMAEFSEEHADQKLFGAPPGYVGYDRGGQLTNAVRENPFSLLLFDEIEKAHPTIMDKFLQVLEDGRMTDGQGNTVYFSETLIVFTSNLGITKQVRNKETGEVERIKLVKPSDGIDKIRESVEKEIYNWLKPEVFNRIGMHNVVVFDFIKDNVAKDILVSRLESVSEYLIKRNIELSYSDSVVDYLQRHCLDDKVRQMGGRGIGNVVEEHYINSLGEAMFDNDIDSGDRMNAEETGGKIQFTAEKNNV